MSCRCAKPTDEYHGWECEITGGACMFLFPDQKKCHDLFEDVGDIEQGDNDE